MVYSRGDIVVEGDRQYVIVSITPDCIDYEPIGNRHLSLDRELFDRKIKNGSIKVQKPPRGLD